jgi:hypothetical protein
MAYSQPLRPSLRLDPRALTLLRGRMRFLIRSDSLLSCTSTPPKASFPSNSLHLSRIHVDHTPQLDVPRLSSLSLQHFRNQAPFFSHLLRNASENRCPDPQKFRTQGLATLSTASQLLNPSEASFSPQHSWDSPFRAFLRTCSRSSLTKTSIRPCTSLENLPAFYPCSNGFAHK